MQIEKRKVSDLKNFEHNPRTITKKAFERLKKQITKLNAYKPLLVNQDGIVLGGNMRLRALKEMGVQEIECSVVYTTNDTEMMEYALSDNDAAGVTDKDILANLLPQLEIDMSMFAVSFDEGMLLSEIAPQEVEEDEAPPVAQGEPESKLGEIYQLGRHRLMCGDSTDAGSVTLLMNGEKADMVFTDPPYNANYKSRGSDQLLRKGIENDNMSNNDFDNFISGFMPRLIENTSDIAVFYICCNWKDSYPRFYFSCIQHGINPSANIVWNKGSGGMGWQDYRYQYEFIIYGFKEGHKWYGGRTETDIWDFNREVRQNYEHPTQKPIKVPAKAIENSTMKEQFVLDLFLGSGSTLIACEQINRICYGMELDPKYCDVIRKRYAKLINKESEWLEVTPVVA